MGQDGMTWTDFEARLRNGAGRQLGVTLEDIGICDYTRRSRRWIEDDRCQGWSSRPLMDVDWT